MAAPMGTARLACSVAPRNAPFPSKPRFDHDHHFENCHRSPELAGACAPVDLPRRRGAQPFPGDARGAAPGARLTVGRLAELDGLMDTLLSADPLDTEAAY